MNALTAKEHLANSATKAVALNGTMALTMRVTSRVKALRALRASVRNNFSLGETEDTEKWHI